MNKWELAPVYLPLITDIGPSCSEVLTHTHTHTQWIIAEKLTNLFTLWTPFLFFRTPADTQTQIYKDLYIQITNRAHSFIHACTLKFFSCGIIRTETTQESKQRVESTHRGKKQLVNNWRCQSATVLSEGTACKHHRRKKSRLRRVIIYHPRLRRQSVAGGMMKSPRGESLWGVTDRLNITSQTVCFGVAGQGAL